MMDKVNEPSTFKSRITDWPLDERPREKLMRLGPESVSNAELIAILIGHGTVKFNALELAKKLLREFKSLESLSGSSLEEIQQIPGIGPAKAVTLLAAFQLYRNLQKQKAENEIVSFRNPEQVAKIYQPILGPLRKESFYVILLNSAMKRILDFEVSRGTLDASLVHPREVFNIAVRNLAKGIILMHNHPSGEMQPSEEDIKITERLVQSGKILEVPVYDHLIIAENNYYSFREHGLIG
ncbi:MAG: DNA repair protein RadC [Calditrichaceae bacterium]|jgi:DNA repair protein RadC